MRIFISYSHQDRPTVDLITARLKEARHEVWIDHLKLRPGDNISRKINEGIGSVDAILVVVSANALRSKWMLQEFSFLALSELSKREPKIIPILLDDSAVPSYLSNYLYLDFSQDPEGGLERLVQSLEVVQRKEPDVPRRSSEQRTDSFAGQVAALGSALKSGRLTLVCGAGVSVGAGIPVWNQLLLRLLESMIERLSKDHSLNLGSDAAEEFNDRHGSSSLILGKYLKNNLGRDFGKKVRDALYSAKPTTCDLIDAIVDLSRPQRNGKPLDSIVTFNFDGLIEENLTTATILNRAIYTEAIKHDPNELPVYHVHGYLPRTGKIPDETEIVFSEDAYHSQFIDPFSWSNLIQLNKLTQNTCLFVGVSLTDPNLRRLLDVTWRKNPDKTLSHYILKKRPRFGTKDDVLDDLARLLEEQDANALGINVIWVDDYDEIPSLLRSIR
ncbi:TIR domain-containing protein [Aeromonas sanarellii]|uniref:TIR domain-containing protein n=1 Tax=Aeromonas sanarellii TaxID=633415 RepID=UPI0028DAA51D|nr:TIR domain-containing protein [Aeromonas veronii]